MKKPSRRNRRWSLPRNNLVYCLRNSFTMADLLLDMGKLGLMGMKERAHLLHGDVEIISKPNKGTTVILEIPQSQ